MDLTWGGMEESADDREKMTNIGENMYSETSDKGHSKRGQISQQRTSQGALVCVLIKITSERGQPLYKVQIDGSQSVFTIIRFHCIINCQGCTKNV